MGLEGEHEAVGSRIPRGHAEHFVGVVLAAGRPDVDDGRSSRAVSGVDGAFSGGRLDRREILEEAEREAIMNCERKTKHLTQASAELTIQAMKRFGKKRRKSTKGMEALCAYQCRTCGFWHVGNDRYAVVKPRWPEFADAPAR